MEKFIIQTAPKIEIMSWIHNSFAIILKWEKSWLLCYYCLTDTCIVTINVLWLFFAVWWVGVQYVIMVFPDHTHLFMTVKVEPTIW